MQLAIDKARETGVGLVSVHNSNHFGAAGYYAHMAIEHDMLGFAATGYFFPNGQRTAVVPFGGLVPMFSTNPLAVACPADEAPPFVLDMSTSVSPVNRLELMQERGQEIPPDWALDADGEPTRDPARIDRLIPLGGLGTGGGHKGFGLAMAVQILTGLLSGAWRASPDANRILGDCKDTVHGYAQEGIAHFFAAVRLDQFADPAEVRRGLDVLAHILNESPADPDRKRVTFPGQLEYETQSERIESGIPLSEQTWGDLQELSRRFRVPLDAGV
jgi:LDH2 family malate/lactate/ureidoglycolate dehydrogenase